MQSLIRLGRLFIGGVLVCVGGVGLVLMLVIGLEAFLAQVGETSTAGGILGAVLGLVLKLVAPVLVVWCGIRCVLRPRHDTRPSC
jgi:Na+/serine symporter